MAEHAPPQHIAVTLSGGGHRASLFGLGALLYLVDAGKGPELAAVSSVSGGSLTNGFVGMRCELTEVRPDDFWRDVQPFARQVAGRGTVWAAPLTIAYLALLAALLVVAVVASFLLAAAWSLVVWVVALLAVGTLAQQRSAVTAKSFDRAVFGGRPLESLARRVDHVICAADLQTAENVYFSGRFVYAWRTGWGEPAGLPLSRAVQASACLPGPFNPVSLPVARHRFAGDLALRRFLLTDGGVYDNMGTEWPVRLGRRLREGGTSAASGPGRNPPPTPAPNDADELIVVNSSAAQDVVARPSLRAPLLGEIATLLAVKDVLYDQTTAVRRRLLDLRFRAARGNLAIPDATMAGTLVQIGRTPYELPDAFAGGGGGLAARARAARDLLGDENRATWAADAAANRGVKTALSKIPAERAASLLRHAYVLSMVNSHVLLGYPLLEVPDDDRFRTLVTP